MRNECKRDVVTKPYHNDVAHLTGKLTQALQTNQGKPVTENDGVRGIRT